MEKRDQLTGIFFISPWLIGLLFFTLVPTVVALFLTFAKWDFLRPLKWVGLDNYKSVVTSNSFYMALSNTLIYMVCSTLISVVFGLVIAALLAKGIPGGHIFRSIFYLPSLVIGTAFGLMMTPVFGYGQYGMINQLIAFLGLPEQKWLSTPGQGVWVMVGMSFWYIGGSMIVFLAGMKGIDQTYYEASMIDGANKVQQFFKITIPLIAPVIIYQIIMNIIYGMQVFDLAVSLNSASGYGFGGASMGSGNNLATLVYDLYTKGFSEFNMGEASVIGWITLIISLILSVIVFKLSNIFNFFNEEEGGTT